MTDPRHVLLNATFLSPAVSGGPETYLRGLAPALAEAFPEVRWTIATTRSGSHALRESGWGDWADIVGLPCEDGQRLRRQVAEQLLVPALARRRRVDLVHSLASVAPIRAGQPSVITLHDVTFMLRRTFSAVTTWGMSQVVVRAARHADGLIAVSGAARDEICAVLGISHDRFSVVHNGGGREPGEPALDERDTRERFALGMGPVVLCVGAKRPHKNQEVLVRALAELPDDVVLVLVGHPEGYAARLGAVAAELEVHPRVRLVDYVPDAELESLWAVAACFAFPTLGEGFGLPLVEAMRRGVAVAASDIAVLREVGGEIPHWFDPHDAGSAASAIRAAIGDTDAERAREQAARFTWEATARGTMAAYQRALAASGR